MKQNLLFASLLLTGGLLIASCSEGENMNTITKNELIEICLSGGVDASATTRAVVDNTYATANDLPMSFIRLDQDESTGAYSDYKNATPLAATRTAGASASGIEIVFDTKQYYLSRVTNNNTKLIGWYPNTGNYVAADGTVTFTLDGETDVMLSDELTGNKAADSQFGSVGKVHTFGHLLAKVTVQAYSTDDDIAVAWGNITDVKVNSQPASCMVTLPSATPTSWGTVSDLTLPGFTAVDLIGSKVALPKSCGTILIQPTTGTDLTLTMTTALGGTRDDVTASLATGTFEAGKSYVVTLKFSATDIMPKATITEWTEGTDPGEVTL